MKSNVVLVGMPGCGKSTIGVVLAKSLGFDFTDTDLIISKQKGKKLQEIIDENGVDYFLGVEGQVGCNLNCNNTVVATGGSMVLCEKAMKNLKQIGEIVYIKVPLEEIKKRITNMKTRGIVFQKGEDIDDVFNNRTPLYEKYADIVVESNDLLLEETVTKISNMFSK